MKNFRKVLALVLVVATLFSFAAMASAATYKDADKISYNEAVAVLSHVGILEGYPEDGTFRPANTITRAEMAKMIAALANAGYDVKDLFRTDVKFADSKDHWAASYIAYCTSTGIVAGRSATTFDPQGKVTGLEVAKMLLVVLGFDAEKQGYIGSDWKLSVKRDAKLMGLLENFKPNYNPDAAITREEAAQMMLNALEAPCVVGYLSNNSITVTNAIVFKNANLTVNDKNVLSAVKVVSHATLKDALKSNNWALYGNVLISNDLLLEKLFNLKKVVGEVGDRDCFGRPTTAWRYETLAGKPVDLYAAGSTPIFDESNTTVAKVEKALEKYEGVKMATYVNGTFIYDRTGKDQKGVLKEAVAALTLNGTAPLGKGIQVQAFYEGNVLTIVRIDTYIAKIANVNTAKNTVTLTDNTGKAAFVAANEFGITTKDVGEVALYQLCNKDHKGANDVHDVKVVKPITVKVTGADLYNDATKNVFYADGKTYEFAVDFNRMALSDTIASIGGTYGAAEKAEIGKTYDIYVDQNGYVMWYTLTSENALYAVVADKSVVATNAHWVEGYKIWDYTAKLMNFEVNPKFGEDVVTEETLYNIDTDIVKHDALISYQLNADKAVVNAKKAAVADAEAMLYKASPNTKGFKNNFVDNGTKIILRTFNTMSGKYEYKFFDGYKAIDGTYALSHAQYFDNGNGALTYVYAEAEYVEAPHTAFLLAKFNQQLQLTDGNQVTSAYVYTALIDGEEGYVAYDVPVTGDMFKVYEAKMQRIGYATRDGKPVYMPVEASKSMTAMEFKYLDGALAWNNGTDWVAAALADNAKVMVIFPETHTVNGEKLTYTSVNSVEGLLEYAEQFGWKHGYAWADFDANNNITLLYVTGTVDAAQN